jgi:hypothetical protein
MTEPSVLRALTPLANTAQIGFMAVRHRPGRKILIASIGVATLNYVAVACSSSSGSGGSTDAASDQLQTTGNLAPPLTSSGGGVTATSSGGGSSSGGSASSGGGTDATTRDVIEEIQFIEEFPVANLVAIPFDAGKDS